MSDGWPACKKRCGACLDCYHREADFLRTRASRMASMLRRLEWAGDCGECPECGNEERQGHKPTCDLATLLRDLP